MSGDELTTLIGAFGEREPLAELHRLADVRRELDYAWQCARFHDLRHPWFESA